LKGAQKDEGKNECLPNSEILEFLKNNKVIDS
jgi:hypothetical protein